MRKLKKYLLTVLMAAAMMLSVTACGGASGSGAAQTKESASVSVSQEQTAAQSSAQGQTSVSSGSTVSFKDMTGQEIKLTEPVKRIVALTPSDCEILYDLGAGDLLVGRGENCDYPADVSKVASVQSGDDTNIEQIIALDPQVVIMGSMAQTKEQVKELEDKGITVVVSEATDIEGVYTSVDMIGKVVGKEDKAAEIIKEMKTKFADLKEKAAKAASGSTKSVYFEVSPLQYGLWTAGKGTFMNEIAQMLGLKNCFDDLDSWAEVSEEQVLQRNPDYIVTITMYGGSGTTPKDEIMSRKGWENVTAVKNGAILNLQNNELSRPVPRLTEGAEQLYELVYGSSSK